MDKLDHPGRASHEGDADDAWRTSKPFDMDDFEAMAPLVDEAHVSGTQLRRRLITPEAIAAGTEDHKQSLLQRLGQRFTKRR